MNTTRSRIQSRGSGRTKPQTPDLSRTTKLPQISTSLASTDESNLSFWSPSRPPGYAVGIYSQQAPPGKNAPETHMFGLFDGHAGGRCSSHLSSNLANALVEEESFLANLPLALKKSFYTVNEQFLKIAEKNKWHDGSTGNVAVIRDGKLTVANVGDCRALLISNGRPLQMSNDHKPTNPDEQKRIASLGGAVVYCMGVARVNKVLAVSRAFGNRTLRQVIRPDAELMQRELVPGDDFLVMASDGLWDVLRNKDVCDVCYSSYLQRRPQAIAEELVNMALARGSMDNVTCIVVNLGDYRPADGSDMDASLRRSTNGLDNSMNLNSMSRSSGSNGIATGFGGSGPMPSGLNSESIVDTQQLAAQGDHYDDDALMRGSPSPQFPPPSSSTPSSRLRNNNHSNNSSNSFASSGTPSGGPSNNNYPAHDIPSKQRSLGTINPRDLPSLGGDADPFGLKNTRMPFVKAVSTNSMSSSSENIGINHGDGTNNTSFAVTTAPSFALSSEKLPNPANGFLRPLTALDAAPLPGNNSNSSNYNNSNGNNGSSYAAKASSRGTSNSSSMTNNNGNNTYPMHVANMSSEAIVSMSSSQQQSHKLAQIRAMKGNNPGNNSNSNMLVSADPMSGSMRAMSRQGSNNNNNNNSNNNSSSGANSNAAAGIPPRPLTQSNLYQYGGFPHSSTAGHHSNANNNHHHHQQQDAM